MPTHATFVLVHGAWHGGWCWARVARLLREAGHLVFTPSLTGLGDRAHLARPEVDLTTHVHDIAGLLDMEELEDAILVGHSYGGMVISGAAAQAPTRAAHLVYLDAFVPRAGQAVMDLLPSGAADAMRAAAKAEGGGWRIPSFSPEHWGIEDPEDAAWVARHLVPQPLRTFEEPLRRPPAATVRRTYVRCTRPARETFDQYTVLRQDPAWRFHEVEAGHDAMVTAPQQIATILHDAAR